MTAISQKTRDAVIAREGGHCARCLRHYLIVGGQVHHRRPRGAGGSRLPSTNGLANLVLLCPADHRWVESNRLLATQQGWLCPSWADPAAWPVERRPGVWQQPTADGWLVVEPNPTQFAPIIGTAS